MLTDSERYDLLPQKIQALKQEIGKRVIGQHEVIENMLIALFSNGNCLFIGVPGLAKTLLVNTVAQSVGLDFGRVQFTPDLLPADITGSEILQQDKMTGERTLSFIKGPVFTNLLLADEINRTPPKTQAALLQAMQEKEVTAGGKTYILDNPFLVFATQNPIEQEGTYPLPEAQLDRFMFSIFVTYPTAEEEVQIVEFTTGAEQEPLQPVITREDLISYQRLLRQVPISNDVNKYAVQIARSTRPETGDDFIKKFVHWGAGPRSSQFLSIGARVKAGMEGRNAATKKDVEDVALSILQHRIVKNFQAQAAGVSNKDIVHHVLSELH
jgi:MoxR-like ATPase